MELFLTALIIVFGLILWAILRPRAPKTPIEHLPGGSPPWPEAPIPPTPPQVVVNVPKDYKPLETLAGSQTTLVGEKALLWWTVYRHTLLAIDEVDAYDITKAVWAADQAVDKVYGVEP